MGDSDWLSAVTDDYGNSKFYYEYANGRPLRVNIPQWWGMERLYFRYNARGDTAGFVDKDGGGGGWWQLYGAWGDVNYAPTDRGYYTWNAAWGYMRFPARFNFDLNGSLDVGVYYVHGRWYNQDTGLWLSPNEKGDYLYGGDGQDPVNIAKGSQVKQEQASSNCEGTWPPPSGLSSVAPLTEAQWFIAKREACRFGLPSELVAGTIAVEIVYDTDWIDSPLDFYLQEVPLFLHYTHPGSFSDVWLNDTADAFLDGYESYWGLFGGRGPGNGIANVHILTAKKVEQYYAANHPGVDWLPPLSTYDRMATLLTDLGNIRYTAAILRQLADLRTNRMGNHMFDLTDPDMEIIYSAFRSDLNACYPADPSGTNLQAFQTATESPSTCFGSQLREFLNPYRQRLSQEGP